MSEITRGVIGMPFDMVMGSELSRRQFYSMAQALLVDRDQIKAESEALRNAAVKVIEMSRQHAEDQYGDSDKAESWSCVTVLRAAIGNGEQP